MATEKQKKFLEFLGQGLTEYDAALKAGYSKNYAKNTYQIKRSKGWGQLAKKHFSEEKVAKALGNLLKQTTTRTFRFSPSYSEEDIIKIMKSVGFKKSSYFAQKITEDRYTRKGDLYTVEFWDIIAKTTDVVAVAKAVDMAMKSWGNYAPEKMQVTEVAETKTVEDKQRRIKELEQEMKELEKEEKKKKEEMRMEFYEEEKKKKSKSTKTAKVNDKDSK